MFHRPWRPGPLSPAGPRTAGLLSNPAVVCQASRLLAENKAIAIKTAAHPAK
jgi:hypothetical protein